MTLFNRRTQNFLTDRDIIALVAQGKVFKSNFDVSQLSGCAYDLRAGDTVTSRNRSKSFELDDCEFVIEPNEVVTVRSLEVVDFSEPMLVGLIVSNHTQVSLGLFHPSTTIDPGFAGPLAITITNQGNTGFRLLKGGRIAKLLLCPVWPTPERVYGGTYRPRAAEGSLEHSLYVDQRKVEEDDDGGEFFGGRIRALVERVEVLERKSTARGTKQDALRYRRVLRLLELVLVGASSGVIVQYRESIGAWIAGWFR